MMLGLMLGETLAAFLMVLIVSFLSFHIWLMSKAMTTVEFCEKSLKKSSYNSSVYSRGIFHNVCAVLGPNPVLWFLPISLPEGDGLDWTKGQPKGQPTPGGDLSGQRDSLIAQDVEARRGSGSAAAEEDAAEANQVPEFRGKSRGAGGSKAQPQAA